MQEVNKEEEEKEEERKERRARMRKRKVVELEEGQFLAGYILHMYGREKDVEKKEKCVLLER